MVLKWLWFCLVSAAAFFVTYECTKSLLGAGGALSPPHMAPVTHMLAASLGEIVSLSFSQLLPSLMFMHVCIFQYSVSLSVHLRKASCLTLVISLLCKCSSLAASFPPL